MLVDANLLLYATDRGSPYHARAAAWMIETFNGPLRVGLPWESLTAFLRIATNPRVGARPLTGEEAWAVVAGWLELPNVWVPGPTDRHADVFGALVVRYHLSANLIPDAHVAALAIEHGLVLYSADTDFARFSELRWENPLSG